MTTAGEGTTKRWDAFMVVLTLASLVPVAWVELAELTWADPLFRKLALVDLAFVGFFASEFCVRFARAPDRPRFMRDNWFDLLGLVPLYAESLAWLRAARMLRILRILRALRATPFDGREYRDSPLGATFTIAAAIMITIATAFYFAENGKNPSVDHWGDALWWAMTTTATVGYGDVVPRTNTGRALAAVLMITGIGLFGVIASTLSAAIMRIRGQSVDDESMQALLRQHRELVLRHARGELTVDELERATADLLKIRGR